MMTKTIHLKNPRYTNHNILFKDNNDIFTKDNLICCESEVKYEINIVENQHINFNFEKQKGKKILSKSSYNNNTWGGIGDITNELERKVISSFYTDCIEFIYQCNHETFSWLGDNVIDFYIPDKNIAIECQHHWSHKSSSPKPDLYTNWKKGKEIEKETKNKDIEKYNLCKEHGIKMIYMFKKGEFPPNDLFIYGENNYTNTTSGLRELLK